MPRQDDATNFTPQFNAENTTGKVQLRNPNTDTYYELGQGDVTQEELDEEIAARFAGDAAEAAAREAADTALQGNIDSEAAARVAGDAAEAGERLSTDTNLQAQITALQAGFASTFPTIYGSDAAWTSSTTYVNANLAGKTFDLFAVGNTISGGLSQALQLLRKDGTSPDYTINPDGGFTLSSAATTGDQFIIWGSNVVPAGVLATKTGNLDLAFVDSNDWCIWAWDQGVQAWPPTEYQIGTYDIDPAFKTLLNGIPTDNNAINTPLSIVDSNGWMLWGITSEGLEWPPVETENVAVVASSPNVWFNRYTNLSKYLKPFFTLSTSVLTPERPIIITGESDSIMVREEHTSVGNVVPNSWPPGMITKNIGAYLYETFIQNFQKTIYNRYDKPSIFTETGAFTTVTVNSAWDDNNDRPTQTRCSTATNAALAFTVPSTITYFNFIDRTSTEGAILITITLPGNGLAQIKDSSGTWVEANGYTFTQRQTANYGNRIGNTAYQRYQFLKNLSGADLLVTISKASGTSEMLMYWGVQYIPLNTESYIIYQNLGRGGHTLEELKNYYETDVILRKPDLVILEIPLLNMVGAGNSLSYVLNWVQDFIYGDRAGATNSWNLKTKSNNWTDFQLVVIIPHISNGRWNADGTPIVNSTGLTSRGVWNAVKSFLINRNDLALVDMSNTFMRVANAEFGGNNYDATLASGVTGGTLLNDGTHQNDKGTDIYAQHLCPIFDINTY